MGQTYIRAALALVLALASACRSSGSPRTPGSAGGGTTPQPASPAATACAPGHAGALHAPAFVRNLPTSTGWFASPLAADLHDGGGKRLVAATYGVAVYDAAGKLLDSAPGNGQRIYAPHVVTDLDGDGIAEIVVGQGHQVFAYEWVGGRLRLKAGWPFDTTAAGQAPEVRGLAAADLAGDGHVEVVATTTQTQATSSGGAQVFVLSADGRLFQPAGTPFQAWPRYNARTGAGGDADRNGMGHVGFGCYGLNVGIGNLDDDPALEIVVTYDNHFIQAFKMDGTALDASPWFTNRDPAWLGRRLTWGQFIRWFDPAIEDDQWHLHQGAWPSPATGQEWLQWTASPPNVVDLDGDGRSEVVGIPNIETGEPYVTQGYAVMVLQGAQGDGSRSAMRLPAFRTLPRGGRPMATPSGFPPIGIPAAATVNIQGDARPEIVVSLNDGFMYAFDAAGQRLWRFDYTGGRALAFASEPAVADLDGDGVPEIVFTTYGAPGDASAGHLFVLSAAGALLFDVPLPNPASDGNGSGAAAAPSIDDLDGDGQLEILVQTIDHGIDVFTVPGSQANCLAWPTSRGGPLRTGAPSAAR